MKNFARFAAALALFACLSAGAQEADDKKAAVQKFVDSLHFKSGTVAIDAAHATLNLTSEFRFLDAHDAQRVLHDLWGNPPDAEVLGMLIPAGAALTDEKNSWVVVISYSDDGHVSDSEASTLDYDKLLKEMQQSARDSKAEREKQGYPAIEIVGWATPPHYDAASNKLYWARELNFAGAHEHTLNYDIRVLGRGGYLSFNAVAGMHQLAMVKERMPQVLDMAQFDAGQRYADFNSSTDKIAAYGIGALVAGAIAAKAGLFAKLLVLLLAFKKVVIVGFLAVAAAVRKFFKRGDQ
ncbi:MAG TPA: DUF2167 domain-containing protein [Rudaea sp.]|jgi:uncharacterized membrane-anchored protein